MFFHLLCEHEKKRPTHVLLFRRGVRVSGISRGRSTPTCMRRLSFCHTVLQNLFQIRNIFVFIHNTWDFLFPEHCDDKAFTLTHCSTRIHQCPKWKDLVASFKTQFKNKNAFENKRETNDCSTINLVEETTPSREKRVVLSRGRKFEKHAKRVTSSN